MTCRLHGDAGPQVPFFVDDSFQSAHTSFYLFVYLFIIYLLIYYLLFILRWVFIPAHRLSLAGVREGYSLVAVTSLVAEYGVYTVWVQQLWCTGLVALWHEGSSQTRDRTYVPCIARWFLNCWTTREAPCPHFLKVFPKSPNECASSFLHSLPPPTSIRTWSRPTPPV